MSDDDDVILVTSKANKVHYGSLEEQERARLAALAAAARGEAEEPSGKELGDIQISSEYMDLEDEMSKDKKALLEEFERRRKARQLNVSTDDDEVRRSLRQLGEPVCLFGEGPAERRVRLRDLLSYLGEDAINKKLEEEEARISLERDREGTWYHEGPPQLRDARIWIAQYSLPKAKVRLAKARAELEQSGSVRAAAKQDAQRKAAAMGIYCSQIGDNRPISHCRFSSDSKLLITSSWSGLVKIWSVPSFVEVAALKGHTCNVSSATFKPGVTMCHKFSDKVQSQNPDSMDHCSDGDDSNLRELKAASCGYDGSVYLWNFDSDSPLASLEGHSPCRVSRVEFHPSGRFVATTVYDNSWRLWDLETTTEVLHQEGHAKPVHCIAFQDDGSLVITGGLDTFGRVWDLRTGRCVMLMSGHCGGVLGVAGSDHQTLTAGTDHTLRAWDLRTRSAHYTVPAHTHLLSDVRYQPGGRHFIVTSSYDNTAKVWAHPGYHPLITLSGHDNKVMSCDISHDSKYIATSSYDRTIKLWSPELT